MTKYYIDDYSVSILRQTAILVQEAHTNLGTETKVLLMVASERSGALGPHKKSLENALEEILTSIQSSAEAVVYVSEKLSDIADAYEEIMGNDRFSNIGKEINNEPSSVTKSSFLQRLFGHKETASLDDIPVGRLDNGNYFVKGDNYDSFIKDYYSGGLTYESAQGVVVECVSPSQIEGINLGPGEVKNSNVFWGQHNSSEPNPKDFYIDLASKIPQVQTELDRGVPLDELIDDPKLGSCASLFFDPRKIPRVEKYDGYYIFESSGRHRILAARETGYSIPVRVVGYWHRK